MATIYDMLSYGTVVVKYKKYGYDICLKQHVIHGITEPAIA